MPISNRDLLMAQRKKNKGLPATTNKVATSTLSRRSGGAGKGFSGKTGFQAKAERKKQATLTKYPGVTEGIIEPGDALAREFKDLRPSVKVDDASTDMTTGMPSNVSIASQTAEGTDTQRARLAKSRGLGGSSTSPVARFNLPTDRLPSFNELGGAIGGLFKYIGQLSKANRARGLVPGFASQDKNKGKGLGQKDKADIFLKQIEAATLAGDKEKELALKAELDKIVHPDRESDVASIINQ